MHVDLSLILTDQYNLVEMGPFCNFNNQFLVFCWDLRGESGEFCNKLDIVPSVSVSFLVRKISTFLVCSNGCAYITHL